MEQPNLNYINELSGSDDLFKLKFINILKQEFPAEKNEFLDNLRNDLPRAASLNVNKLKYKMSVLGLEQGFERASVFEEELRDGCTRMTTEFIAILNTMDRYINSI
ncbi:Hpt domain-containing protein [Zeaxanthinibacter sp. PT1]|uniref:Hpt domain-containing protein n=1 Tax=Zeaxanthinibacter TaxID=561554 RepID=UPI002349FA66|nr:Hpt domain-containing protein [Zeaxanthinibacter sp. PT1]MDC6352110.1 Hpt domain-containing protein [Zeaxanthinibacter sp. PT1]